MSDTKASDGRPDAPPAAADTPSFEDAFARLEALVRQLDAGELPLEESLAAFEQGVALARACAQQLASAERRIEILLRDGDALRTRPFDVAASAEDDPSSPAARGGAR
ncbi:MAG TPA: exodeoxyribonuclease VII small subunit [Myxococcota bacterium]|jgi:exodeoxyribonuclease VII small subunit|nr:exodeoxyribonuclease VII small subunit [Myxococcota bacterium]